MKKELPTYLQEVVSGPMSSKQILDVIEALTHMVIGTYKEVELPTGNAEPLYRAYAYQSNIVKALTKTSDDAIAVQKVKLDKLQEALMNSMGELDEAKTPHGTFKKVSKELYSADWPVFNAWALAQAEPFLYFEKRLLTSAINKLEVVPPGVKTYNKVDLKFTPSKGA